jgi:hypothetical protein
MLLSSSDLHPKSCTIQAAYNEEQLDELVF